MHPLSERIAGGLSFRRYGRHEQKQFCVGDFGSVVIAAEVDPGALARVFAGKRSTPESKPKGRTRMPRTQQTDRLALGF
jgi:hypothetical protein